MPLLKLDKITCGYEGQTVIENLSFHLNQGEIISLLGSSGCGKTTALRAIAGFESIRDGSITLNGNAVSTPGYSLEPENRGIGMVFQDYALFPHLTVMDNICFSKNASKSHALELIKETGLEGMEKRYPHELSGGQQQRVALARALAARPSLLLMDEPFSNLDVELRERLSHEIRDILKAQNIACILVTHDQNEAFAMSDKIGIMHKGKITQWDTPFNLYHEPANRYVANFIGQGVFIKGEIVTPNTFETEFGVLKGDRAYTDPIGTCVEILLRPDDVLPNENGDITATIVDKAFKGAETLYTLELESGTQLLSLFPSHNDLNKGDSVKVCLEADHLVSFPCELNKKIKP